MAEDRGKVTLVLQLEIPIKKSWHEDYVFNRLLSEVRRFQARMVHQFGVGGIFDLIQSGDEGLIKRRECPHMVPGQESDSEGL